MRNRSLQLTLSLLAGFAGGSSLMAQQAITPAPIDPAIARAIAGIDPDKIYGDVAKLVSFKNRSTISSVETDLPAGTGVTAANFGYLTPQAQSTAPGNTSTARIMQFALKFAF